MSNVQNQLAIAISIAANAHVQQYDKGGNAYILHALAVMNRVKHYNDAELMIIAVLHDVVEDSQGAWTFEHLSEYFSHRVIKALCLMTKEGQSYDEYIRMIGTNIDALRVKLADLEENTCVTRLKGLTEKDFQRMQKYHKAYTYLKNIQQVNGVINKID